MTALFFTALAVGFSGAMMPGSLLTYTIRQSLKEGPKVGFIVIVGHALLELALIIGIFLGLDMVLRSDAAQITIGLIGGILLCYIGADMIVKAARGKVSVDMDAQTKSSDRIMLSGALLSMANPYFLLWWAVIGLGFLTQAYRDFAVWGVAVYFAGHITADFAWYGLISTVVGTTRKFIKQKPYRIIIMVLGGLLIFFGARFLIDALGKLF
ncbi:MAG TPA: LysE family transporter [Candidatus Limiplasma sp.]|nr:LysE family transporter [Candidatus Limiplasma sp.]HRX07757.1 LysE family transporter [Candidatus Limiplasma sp.]